MNEQLAIMDAEMMREDKEKKRQRAAEQAEADAEVERLNQLEAKRRAAALAAKQEAATRAADDETWAKRTGLKNAPTASDLALDLAQQAETDVVVAAWRAKGWLAGEDNSSDTQ
jgi:hypothetical protein